MDPQACFDWLLADLRELAKHPDEGSSDTRADCVDGLRDLASWLQRGGFPPIPPPEAPK